ncbi:MAG: MGH1-like glycoside hydrolase domain-containing protein, partial [Chloroflexota bacterium]
VLTEAPADEEAILALPFEGSRRLLIRISGGGSKAPRAVIHLEGLDGNGNRTVEALPLVDERWGYGFGVVSSGQLYTQIDRIRCEGLSRVYRVSVHTVDYTRLDINAVLPLMLTGLPDERAEPLLKLLTDEAHFWRPSGLTIVSASDDNYDPSSANGGGGVWPYWITLIGEGLLLRDRADLVAAMLKRLLATQVHVLRQHKRFSEFYHAEDPTGLGEPGHLNGIVPLYLLLRTLGVQIVDSRRVYTEGAYHWGTPVTITQHGVRVQRDEGSTRVTFPSGTTVSLGADAPWQLVEDTAAPLSAARELRALLPPELRATGTFGKVMIQVEHDDES